jgi:[acyl-carrier-protein] S-malonyltransferase
VTGLVAILCSGQGAQHPDMFRLTDGCAAAEPVFAAATDVLGEDPRQLVRGAERAMFEDEAAQVLCCTAALATWLALGSARPSRAVFAGYSVGEVAAWGCAGTLDVVATLRLALGRARAMDAAAPAQSGLAGIVGLNRAMLDPILAAHGVHLAIVNDLDSFVVGGADPALDAVCRAAAASGATRAVRLRVAVPSHTPLLATAVEKFRALLEQARPQAPVFGYRLLTGTDGSSVFDMAAASEKLALQIAHPIDWAACLEGCRAAGAERALELGPGAALSRMASRFFPGDRARSADDFRTLQGLSGWLSADFGQ